MSMRLEGKVAVVTGGGGGIGTAVVEALAAEGSAVVVNDHGVTVNGESPSHDAADAVVAKVNDNGGRAIAHYGSVADFDIAGELMQLALDTYGRLDFLVTPHGILRERMIFNMSSEEWSSVTSVHLDGSFNCVRHATAHMRKQRTGSVVLFTSTAGLEGSPGQANYSAAKLGIVGLGWSTALAMGKYNVNVNVISPSAATRMTARLLDEFTGGPLDHRGPATVGAVTAALCAPEARHITGQIYFAGANRVGRYSHFTEVERCFQSSEEWSTDEAVDAITRVMSAPPLPRFARRNLELPRLEQDAEQGA
jgi:NAD(P)-dependent dehydrogenase (short-subunit alcohol dehydrogenase family)